MKKIFLLILFFILQTNLYSMGSDSEDSQQDKWLSQFDPEKSFSAGSENEYEDKYQKIIAKLQSQLHVYKEGQIILEQLIRQLKNAQKFNDATEIENLNIKISNIKKLILRNFTASLFALVESQKHSTCCCNLI
ncbi:MAG: hypothetical protein ABIF12_00030 [bacterium]